MSTEYHSKINQIYMRLFSGITWESTLPDIYKQAGEAYAEIYELNCKNGYWKIAYGFDNTLVYYMAEWIKTNVLNEFIANLTVKEIADETANQILDYYKTYCSSS
jgi:hypothetical protein